jgi:hypothetical protein
VQKSLSLSEIWLKTNGIHIEGELIYLRVRSPERPVTFLPNQPWLASYSRLDADHWEVGIRDLVAVNRGLTLREGFEGAPLKWSFQRLDDEAAANSIHAHIHGLKGMPADGVWHGIAVSKSPVTSRFLVQPVAPGPVPHDPSP